MADLVDFLRERVAEDRETTIETLAQRAYTQPMEQVLNDTGLDDDSELWTAVGDPVPDVGMTAGRAMRELILKQEIIKRHRPAEQPVNGRLACEGCGTGPNGQYRVADVNDCPDLRLVGAIYIDHPEWREEWRP